MHATIKPILTIALFVLLSAPKVALAEISLLIFETSSCPYCAKWNREISQIYPKTQEGKVAPLIRLDLYKNTPDIKFESNIRVTPTFVLVQNKVELGRIEGYTSDEQFWTLLSYLFGKINTPLNKEES